MYSQNQHSIKKTIFSFIIIFCSSFSLSLFAQDKVQVLDETSMRALMEANKAAGKPTLQGINTKITISTTDTKVSVEDSAKIVKNILNLPGVFSCVYRPSKQSLIVKSQKEENVYKIISIKGELVPFKVYITKNEEITYTEKK